MSYRHIATATLRETQNINTGSRVIALTTDARAAINLESFFTAAVVGVREFLVVFEIAEGDGLAVTAAGYTLTYGHTTNTKDTIVVPYPLVEKSIDVSSAVGNPAIVTFQVPVYFSGVTDEAWTVFGIQSNNAAHTDMDIGGSIYQVDAIGGANVVSVNGATPITKTDIINASGDGSAIITSSGRVKRAGIPPGLLG